MTFSNFCVLLILLQSSFIVTDPTTTTSKMPDTPSTNPDTTTEQTTKMTTNEPDLTTPTMTPTTDSNGISTVSYSTIQIETTLSDALTNSSYQTKGNVLISIVTSVVVVYFSQIY